MHLRVHNESEFLWERAIWACVLWVVVESDSPFIHPIKNSWACVNLNSYTVNSRDFFSLQMLQPSWWQWGISQTEKILRSLMEDNQLVNVEPPWQLNMQIAEEFLWILLLQFGLHLGKTAAKTTCYLSCDCDAASFWQTDVGGLWIGFLTTWSGLHWSSWHLFLGALHRDQETGMSQSKAWLFSGASWRGDGANE